MPRVFLVWLILASCIGWAVYQLKYEVQRLEDRLAKVNHQIVTDQEATQVLKAEWSYLNQPQHLSELARKFLDLEPVQGSQLVALSAVPAKPGAPVPIAVAVAAASPAPAATKPAKLGPDLDEESTSTPEDLPDAPIPEPTVPLLLVKGVPQ